MGFHKDLDFASLHKAKVQQGLLVDLPVSPDGAGDIYFATDANAGDGALYFTNAAGDTWVEFVSGGTGEIKVSSDDTTPNYIESKLVAGTGISLTTQNPGGNENILIAVSGLDAANIGYTPSDNSKWNSSADPGQTDDALDQLASRVKTIETTTFDASAITYTPVDNTDWNGNADPGQTDDALDQLADRVKTLEGGGGGGADIHAQILALVHW